MLTYEPWRGVTGLRHGFLEATDCAAAPDWQAVMRGVGVDGGVFMPKLVHGVGIVEAPVEAGAERPLADAAATSPGRALVGVTTADCVPVLLLDRRARAAAAVHAGWRGAAGGVLEAAVAHLNREHAVDATDLDAVIGPAIGPCCYEVGSEVRDAFVAHSGRLTAAAWDDRGPKPHLDLRRAVELTLRASGVGSTALVGGCTRCDPRLHSFRRDGAAAGRQLSFIGWA